MATFQLEEEHIRFVSDTGEPLVLSEGDLRLLLAKFWSEIIDDPAVLSSPKYGAHYDWKPEDVPIVQTFVALSLRDQGQGESLTPQERAALIFIEKTLEDAQVPDVLAAKPFFEGILFDQMKTFFTWSVLKSGDLLENWKVVDELGVRGFELVVNEVGEWETDYLITMNPDGSIDLGFSEGGVIQISILLTQNGNRYKVERLFSKNPEGSLDDNFALARLMTVAYQLNSLLVKYLVQ